MNNRQLGSIYENKAAAYLESLGMRTVERNFRTGHGEIDLVMDDHGTIVFVEVKYRRNAAWGYALEAVDRRKQLQIRRMAREYLQTKSLHRPVRFDCVGYTGAEFRYIRGAF